MKTIQEQSNSRYKFSHTHDRCSQYDGFDMVCAQRDAFEDGAKFSQRWIPVEEYLPDKDNCDKCLWKNKDKIWFGTAWESDKPTHWRPIELK